MINDWHKDKRIKKGKKFQKISSIHLIATQIGWKQNSKEWIKIIKII